MPGSYTERHVQVNGLKLHVLEWANPGAPALVMVHGFTRQAHDFVPIGERYRDRFRCVSLSVRGRGGSDWGPPETYNHTQYREDLAGVLDALGIERMHYLGASMGGRMGMNLAAERPEAFLTLALNDIGPDTDPAYQTKTQAYLDSIPRTFPTFEALVSKEDERFPWHAELTAGERETLYRPSVRQNDDGSFSFHYDPALISRRKADGPSRNPPDMAWQGLRALTCPILEMWGQLSRTLNADMVARLREAKPELKVVPFEGVGHMPLMMDPRVHQALDALYGP